MKRNNQKVIDSFTIDKSGREITKTGCIIRIPAWYLDKELLNLGENPRMVGIYQVILPSGEYSICKKINMYQLGDMSYSYKNNDDGDSYVEFQFEPGSAVFKNTRVIADKILVYNVFDGFIGRAYVPDFMDYDDMLTLFRDVRPSTLNSLGANPAIMQSIVAHCARHPDDLGKLYRVALNEGYKGKPAWISFSNVIYGPKTALAKLNGSYFNIAHIAAMTEDNDKPERIEELLRR